MQDPPPTKVNYTLDTRISKRMGSTNHENLSIEDKKR